MGYTDDLRSLSHTKWNCKYHIVFAPKYRRKAFYSILDAFFKYFIELLSLIRIRFPFLNLLKEFFCVPYLKKVGYIFRLN